MKKKTKFKRGKVVSTYLNGDTPDELLEWLDGLSEVGPAILEILIKVVNGQYIEIKDIAKYVNVSQILSESINIKQNPEIKELSNSDVNSYYDSNLSTVREDKNNIPMSAKDEIKQPVVEKVKQPVVEDIKQPVVEEVESSIRETLIDDDFIFEDINEKDNLNRTNENKGKAKLQFSFDI